ncbi:MAG: response regulator [Planctomycetes bacterium]|nr:response regulator [Planctomycetota bacterium]
MALLDLHATSTRTHAERHGRHRRLWSWLFIVLTLLIGSAAATAAQQYAGEAASDRTWRGGWDYFMNYGRYLPHTRSIPGADGNRDWTWIAIIIGLNICVLAGCLRIFLFWRRNYLAEAPQDRNRKMMDLAYVFLLCALSGCGMSLLMVAQPEYRLQAVLLLLLCVYTWRFNYRLNELGVSLSALRINRQLEYMQRIARVDLDALARHRRQWISQTVRFRQPIGVVHVIAVVLSVGTAIGLSQLVLEDHLHSNLPSWIRELTIAIYATAVIGVAMWWFMVQPLRRGLAERNNSLCESLVEAEELNTRLRRLSLVASRTDNAVVMLSTEGRIEWVNAGFTRHSGYMPEEAIGQLPHHLLRCITAGTEPETINAILEMIEKHEPVQAEVCNLRKDGRPYWIALEIQPVYDEVEKLEGFVAIELDITERKCYTAELIEARRAAEEASAAKSRFLANMSHEIRTPINGVLGALQLLRRGDYDQRERRYYDAAETSAQALLTLINDILDFSKIEAGQLELHEHDCDLSQLLESIMTIFSIKVREKGIELIHRIAPDVPRRLRGDEQRLRQIIINLVNNAVKFTDSGEIEVVIDLEPRLTDKHHVGLHMSVRDTGMGISPEGQKRLFRSFTQVDGSMARKHGGTGLGLAICKQLIEMMGGEIHVDSETGRGSTFQFCIRMKRRNGDAGLPCDALTFSDLNVLVVEDRDTVATALRTMLESWRCRVFVASTLCGARDALLYSKEANARYDLILLDVMLGDEDGLTLLREIRSDAHVHQPRVIVCSMRDPSELGDLRALGADAFIDKPIGSSRLFDTIRSVLYGDNASVHAVSTDAFAVIDDADATPVGGDLPVLVAEDNPINQLVTAELLREAGYKPTVVENGQKAIEAIKTSAFAIVLMDCQMPEIDGFEATARVRAMELSGEINHHPTIIALTANAIEGDRERCISAGMDDYLSKPIDKKDLVMTIERARTERANADISIEDLPIDLGQLLKRMSGNVKLVRLVLDESFRQIPEDATKLKEAMSAGDREQIKSIAHRIKGGTSQLCAGAIQQCAASLEDAALTAEIDALASQSSELVQHVAACISARSEVYAALDKVASVPQS